MQKLSRRQIIRSSVLAGSVAAVATTPTRRLWAANDELRLGFIGCGGRGNELLKAFEKIDGVQIRGLCDADESAVKKTHRLYPAAKTYSDLRELIGDSNIDAVVIAACNHWHCLAAIWAMQAGKDVYVEKPLSHSQWEGEQTVAAARRYNRIVQVGTQQRSDPMQVEIKDFLHRKMALGDIKAVRVNRYGVRDAIGKTTEPLKIDPSVNYDLWLGPALDKPIFRNKLQYDWHWDFNTGSGEMGNWGVHVLDDVRNVVFRDSVSAPRRIFGGGGRVLWNDAGETPNLHFAYFDTGSIPVFMGLANITNGQSSSANNDGSSKSRNSAAEHPGPASGYIVYCEGGRFEGQRGKGTAFDKDGKQIKAFKGTSGMGLHQQNFADAVRSRDRSSLNAEVQVGHDSSGWCNFANIAYRAGGSFDRRNSTKVDSPYWSELMSSIDSLLGRHGTSVEKAGLMLSPVLTIDPKTQRFVGDHAESANRFIRREYRKGFEVPAIES